MDELVEWLRVQLDDDERVAREAGAGRWSWSHGYGAMCNDKECPYGQLVSEDDEAATVLMDVHGYDVHEGWEGAAHIARHDPARVLRDVEAARERLALIERLANYTDSPEDSVTTISMNALRTVAVNELLWAEVLPYVDRPGYREEWRP